MHVNVGMPHRHYSLYNIFQLLNLFLMYRVEYAFYHFRVSDKYVSKMPFGFHILCTRINEISILTTIHPQCYIIRIH